MCSALVGQDVDAADRFEHVLDQWQKLCGGMRPRFNNGPCISLNEGRRIETSRSATTCVSTRVSEGADLHEVLEFYFQCCAIEVTAEMMAALSATLANGGVCPTSGDRVLRTSTVQNCLSLMCSCGMYGFSGEFAFSIGLPAKSGVGGGLMIVVPNLVGICVWSPRLDQHGNSVRGLAFCEELVETFKVHNYDSLVGVSTNVIRAAPR